MTKIIAVANKDMAPLYDYYYNREPDPANICIRIGEEYTVMHMDDTSVSLKEKLSPFPKDGFTFYEEESTRRPL